MTTKQQEILNTHTIHLFIWYEKIEYERPHKTIENWAKKKYELYPSHQEQQN